MKDLFELERFKRDRISGIYIQYSNGFIRESLSCRSGVCMMYVHRIYIMLLMTES